MIRLFTFLAALVIAASFFTSSSARNGEPIPDGAASLVVAGGCFWCVEKDFETMEGVYEAVSGYAGGTNQAATYQNHEGHREVVEIYYDPSVWTYGQLVRTFLRTIDVTDAGGQFCDRGHAYTTAVHYRTEAQKTEAETAIAEAATALQADIATVVEPLPFFVTAEDYHQDYYQKNPVRYGFYRQRCGRNARVKAVWGDAAAIK